MRHYWPSVHSLMDLAWQTDKGIVLAPALVESLRGQRVLLPAPNVIERACAEAITRANRRTYAALADPGARRQRAAFCRSVDTGEIARSRHIAKV